MKPVVLHPEAEAEIEDAADRYEAARPGYGERFREEIEEALRLAGSTPTVFTPYQGGPARRILLHTFPYGVYFVEQGAAVHVVAVVNQRRKPDYWQDRLDDI